ncbi:hypothetical protein [Roseimicrobium gellanilyticum]|nr:hypothetical protein [Roseimicrobium gellanilyticum]
MLVLPLLLLGSAWVYLKREIANPLRIQVASREYLGVGVLQGHRYQIDVENPSDAPVHLHSAYMSPVLPDPEGISPGGGFQPVSIRGMGSDISSATSVSVWYPMVIPPRSTARLECHFIIGDKEPHIEYYWASERRYRAHAWFARQSLLFGEGFDTYFTFFTPRQAGLTLASTGPAQGH